MSKFLNILNGEVPVLIDFFAEWCGPCKMMTPILQDVKNELKDGLTILKIDIDKNQSIAAKYHIKGVPTLMLFRKGKMMWRQSGMLYKNDLISVINQYK